MYEYLRQVFSFPDYFGNNYDALWDYLNEQDEKTKIEILNADQIIKNLGNYGQKLLDLLAQLEAQNHLYQIYYLNE